VQQLIFTAAESKIEVSCPRKLIKYDPTNVSTAKAVEYFEKYLDELNSRGNPALKIAVKVNVTSISYSSQLRET